MHQLIEQAEPYYLTTGFHVAEHGAEVLNVAQELSALVLAEGIRVDGQVIVLGSKWHDAGMAFTPSDFYIHDKDTVRPAANNEEVAVELFTQAATRVDAPRRLIRSVNGVIASTNPLVMPKTTEAKIMAAADIHGVGFDPYDKFVAGTRALWHEAKWRQGREIEWSDFVKGAMGYLGLFMARDIHLTPRYYDEQRRSAWHVGAVSNVLGLAHEVWDDEVTAQGSWTASHDFRLSLGNDSEQVDITLPVNARTVPLPNDLLDSLRISSHVARKPGVAKEVGRLLHDSGVLEVG
jgi:hypothetical protein